jgi:hypothetical protein
MINFDLFILSAYLLAKDTVTDEISNNLSVFAEMITIDLLLKVISPVKNSALHHSSFF